MIEPLKHGFADHPQIQVRFLPARRRRSPDAAQLGAVVGVFLVFALGGVALWIFLS